MKCSPVKALRGERRGKPPLGESGGRNTSGLSQRSVSAVWCRTDRGRAGAWITNGESHRLLRCLSATAVGDDRHLQVLRQEDNVFSKILAA